MTAEEAGKVEERVWYLKMVVKGERLTEARSRIAMKARFFRVL